MAKPSVLQSQLWFALEPRGFGWDMISAYDQRTLNGLLLQAYIERFSDDRQLPLISESVESDYSTDHLVRMRLREPVASFARSDLGSDEVRLSMDFVGGLVVTELHRTGSPYIATVREISPVGAPRLNLGVALTDLTVDASDGRSMLLDISEGTDFRATFALDSLTQERIGQRFKEIFGELSAEQKTFPLGAIGADLPPPRTIVMRLMAVPGEADSGDGALLMFVNLFREFDGTLPGEHTDFLYPIPADVPENLFSATVMAFNQLAPVAASASKEPLLPIIIEELFFGEHLSHYAYAFGLSVPYAQMASYGNVAPSPTAFAIEPLQPVVVAGRQQAFRVPPAVFGVQWQVRNTGGEEGDPGVISNSGVYQAPAAQSLTSASKTVLVSATGTFGGVQYTATALVSVLRSSVSVSPLFATCNAGDSVPLSAETPPGGNLPRWALRDPALGGRLSVTSGTTCMYTAKDSSWGDDMYIEVIEVRNPDTGEMQPIHVLVFVGVISLPLFVSKWSWPETNRVQLQVMINGVPVNLGDLESFSLEFHGYTGGYVSDDGVYSAPEDAEGLAIMLLRADDGFMTWIGFIVLPMPLWAHAAALRQIFDSVWQHARESSIGLPGPKLR